LEAEHARAAGVRWDGGATEQLVAGDRALAAGLVVGVELERRGRAELPVGGQREEAAPAIGVLDERVHVLVRRIHADAKIWCEPGAEVDRDIARAVGIGAE